MIYLKRFGFSIVVTICMLIGVLGSIIQIVFSPIWGIPYYVFTGKDPMGEDTALIWKYSMNFMEWYGEKFGPND